MPSSLRRIYDKYLFKQNETELETIRKKVMAPTAACVVLTCTALMLTLVWSGRGSAYLAMLAVWIASFGFGLVVMITTKSVPSWLILLLIVTSNFGCIWGDFLSSADGGNFRIWPMMLLNLDLLILCKVPASAISFSLFTLLLWIAITTVEDSRRFGLYDIDMPGVPSYAARIKMCSCKHPPCPIGEFNGALRMCFFSFVILLQFYFMTKVSHALNAEKDRVGASVKTTNNIARYLRQYDLERATAILEEERDVLPSGLLEAFHALINNLERYKPYLPQSCFAEAPVSDLPETTPTAVEENRNEVTIVEQFLVSTLQSRPVSILIINVVDSLNMISRDRNHFERLYENLLNVSVKTINNFDGMIDTFHGDHIQASWNGVKRCILSTTKSARAAVQIKEGYIFPDKVNFGIASGKAECGALGTTDLKRYSIVSGIHNWAYAVERAGRSLGVDIVCDSATRAEASYVLPIKANVQRVRLPKRGTSEPAILWEILVSVNQKVHNPLHSNGLGSNSEWMYEIQSDFMQSLELYNRVVVAYLEGHDVRVLARELDDNEMSYHLRGRIHKPPPAVLNLAFPNASEFLANNEDDQFSTISESVRSQTQQELETY